MSVLQWHPLHGARRPPNGCSAKRSVVLHETSNAHRGEAQRCSHQLRAIARWQVGLTTTSPKPWPFKSARLDSRHRASVTSNFFGRQAESSPVSGRRRTFSCRWSRTALAGQGGACSRTAVAAAAVQRAVDKAKPLDAIRARGAAALLSSRRPLRDAACSSICPSKHEALPYERD